MMLKISLRVSAALCALAGPALADTAEDTKPALQEMVEVVGFRPVAIDDVTASVSVIDAADLAVRNSPFVADQLRAVPGLGVSRSGSVGGLTQVRLRGGEANHTLVLLDGVEVSDPVTGETDFGLWSGLDVARIEVARGEQSALFGSDAIGGVIALQTGDQGLRGGVEYGSFDTLRGHAGGRLEDTRGALGFAVAGFTTDGVDTSGRGGEKDGSDSWSGLVNAEFALGGAWHLKGLASFRSSQTETDPDTDFDGQLDNADRVTEAEQWLAGGVLEGQALGLDHRVRFSASQVERENFADGVSDDTARGERQKLSYSPSLTVGIVTLSGLVDWEREDYRARDNQFGGFSNQDQSFETLGLAGEARVDFEALSLNASVRHDDNDGRFDDAVTWRAGTAYGFDFGGKLRASIGRGVKNPTFTELFGFFPGSFVGNPDLKPEISISWEIGWEQTTGDATWSLTWFEAELEDEIFTAFNPNSTSTARNRIGDSQRSGLEAGLAWQLSERLAFNGAVSNLSSEDETGADEIRVPEWTGSAAISWQGERARFGLAVDYVGEQLDTDFGTFSDVRLDDYWLVSASVDVPMSERLALTLRGENLLDETVTDVFGYHGTGAGVFIGLKVR